MQILDNIKIRFTVEDLMHSVQGVDTSDKIRDQVQWVYHRMDDLITPRALTGLFKITAQNQNGIKVFNEAQNQTVQLTVGPKSGLLKPANLVQVSVMTLGRELDNYRKTLEQRGRHLRAFILDTAGVLALNRLGRSLDALAEKEAADRQCGVGHRLAPGSLIGWDIKDQQTICQLLPIKDIDVSISSTGMLKPLKSAAGVVGIGKGYTSGKVKSPCTWCQRQATCIWAED